MRIRSKEERAWRRKQKAAAPSRYYGDGGTIHHNGYLDVETHHGTVVAVWFRCQRLPFRQSEVREDRASELEQLVNLPELTGIDVDDDHTIATGCPDAS